MEYFEQLRTVSDRITQWQRPGWISSWPSLFCVICRVGKNQRIADNKDSESGVVQFSPAPVVHVACSGLQNMNASHDRQKDQSQHDSVFDSCWAIVAFQESDDAMHGEDAAGATGCKTFIVNLLLIPPAVQ